MYININDPDGKKDKNIPQVITSLILGISASIFFFGLLFLIGTGIILSLADGSESILSLMFVFLIPALTITLIIAILVGLWLSRIIHKKRIALVSEGSPAAQNREISLYILSGLLVLVLCCLGGLTLLIATG